MMMVQNPFYSYKKISIIFNFWQRYMETVAMGWKSIITSERSFLQLFVKNTIKMTANSSD